MSNLTFEDLKTVIAEMTSAQADEIWMLLAQKCTPSGLFEAAGVMDMKAPLSTISTHEATAILPDGAVYRRGWALSEGPRPGPFQRFGKIGPDDAPSVLPDMPEELKAHLKDFYSRYKP